MVVTGEGILKNWCNNLLLINSSKTQKKKKFSFKRNIIFMIKGK